MNKTGKLILGIVTILPIVYMISFFFFFMTILDNSVNFRMLILMHIGTMFLIGGLMIFYVMNAYNSPKIPGDKRTLWVIILFLGGIVAMPIYWYQYIWKDPPELED